MQYNGIVDRRDAFLLHGYIKRFVKIQHKSHLERGGSWGDVYICMSVMLLLY